MPVLSVITSRNNDIKCREAVQKASRNNKGERPQIPLDEWRSTVLYNFG
jgi:hypothetical protein